MLNYGTRTATSKKAALQ